MWVDVRNHRNHFLLLILNCAFVNDVEVSKDKSYNLLALVVDIVIEYQVGHSYFDQFLVLNFAD